LAMHVAATNPQALDPSGLDPAIVTREKDVLADKYRQQGKAEDVIVALESAGKTDELAVLGRQLAMHVAAANPQALDPAGLDPAVVTREKDVLADKYRQQGKPENVIEKIVESGLKTYYKEVCLLEQAFIHDEKGKSVAQAVKEAEGKIGGPVKIAGFVRYALGEGIEKQESDFAAEVAAASGKK